MAKKTISKFKDDDISNALISRYGDVIKSGTEVIESLGYELEVVPFIPEKAY